MGVPLTIVDFDDPDFDPFLEFDKASGLDEIDDPYPVFARLRRQKSVHEGALRDQFGLPANLSITGRARQFMALGYEEVSQAFNDGDTFNNGIMAQFYEHGFGNSINGMDAPEHPRYRKLFQKAFMPNVISKWGETLVPKVINGLIDQFAERGKAELVSEFTSEYPFQFIFAQLELPEHDREIFHKLTVGLTCGGTDPAHMLEASQKLGAYLSQIMEERRAQPGTDIVSMLAHAESEGELLPQDVLVSFLRQLMNAGGDTTYRATSALLTGLLTNPDQLDAVRRDRSLVPRAVEEALRWECPVATLLRSVSRDVVLGGVHIPAGSQIDIVAGSANRDETHFENPDQFNIFRKPARHFGFGFGPHICIGQHLARLEMTRALSGLLDRLPDLRLDEDMPPPVLTGMSMRAPRALHVRFG